MPRPMMISQTAESPRAAGSNQHHGIRPQRVQDVARLAIAKMARAIGWPRLEQPRRVRLASRSTGSARQRPRNGDREPV